jgi:bla regulator protein BlaR1
LPPFVNQDDVRNAGVVVVVTKDSPEGKVYLKKLDNTSNNGTGTILLTGSLKHSQSNKNSTQVFVSDYKLIPKGSSGWTAVKANSKSAVTTGTNVNVDTSIKANKQFNVLYSFTVDTNTKKPIKAKIIRVSSASNVSVNGKNTASQNISVNNDKGMHISFDKDKTPLIIVDGKEIPAADMKSLNPNNIDSMSVLNGEGATKKYGDKAKDGVILISTKRRPLKD